MHIVHTYRVNYYVPKNVSRFLDA